MKSYLRSKTTKLLFTVEAVNAILALSTFRSIGDIDDGTVARRINQLAGDLHTMKKSDTNLSETDKVALGFSASSSDAVVLAKVDDPRSDADKAKE